MTVLVPELNQKPLKGIYHHIKTWPEEFQAIFLGMKTFEIRFNDRLYSVGDYLVLEEWSPTLGDYTGRVEVRYVSYITEGGMWGLPDSLCVMSLQ